MNGKRRKIVAFIYFLLICPLFVEAIKKIYQWQQKAVGKEANIIIDASSPGGEINQKLWQNFSQGGEEDKDMLEPIVYKLRALKPQLIRIDHVFDRYQLFQKNGSLDFSHLDKTVQTILKAGAKPMFSLSYIPSSLSIDGQVTSPPKDWIIWQELVSALVEHYSGKNNLNITEIYYEVYNEPDLFGNWHYDKDPNYLTLYFHTATGAQKARQVNPYKIGGPATTSFYPNWIKALIDFCQKNNLPLDFISWHRYSPNLDDYDQDLNQLISILTNYPQYQQAERLITEFGPGSEKVSWYENRVGAVQAIAVSSYLLDKAHRIFAFEIKDGPEKLTSSWGMMNHENSGALPKPRWNAYVFLNQLKGKRLPLEGNGRWVSGVAAKDNREIKVLLVNFDPQQKHQEYVPVRIQNLVSSQYQVSLDSVSYTHLTLPTILRV